MCLETLKELMIGVQDWDQIKQLRDCESPSDGEALRVTQASVIPPVFPEGIIAAAASLTKR